MKKNLLLLAGIIFLFSCSDDVPSIPDPALAPKISSVPSNFDQKIVIESYTKATCGSCPKAHLYLDSLIKYNPDRVYGVSFHVDDVMMDYTLLASNGQIYYDSIFNPSATYPAGTVNRKLTTLADIAPDLWASNALFSLGKIPSCGIALEADKISGSTVTLTIHVGFNAQMFGDYRIHAYVVENQVQKNDSLYDQMNDFSINGATPDSLLSLYALDDTIHQYKHNYVFRKDITSVTGTPVPQSQMFKGNHYVLTFDVDMTGLNMDNSSIIVFLDKHATIRTGHLIENVQSVPVGSYKDWN